MRLQRAWRQYGGRQANTRVGVSGETEAGRSGRGRGCGYGGGNPWLTRLRGTIGERKSCTHTMYYTCMQKIAISRVLYNNAISLSGYKILVVITKRAKNLHLYIHVHVSYTTCTFNYNPKRLHSTAQLLYVYIYSLVPRLFCLEKFTYMLMRDAERSKQGQTNNKAYTHRALCLECRVLWVQVPPEAAHFS